MKRLRVSRARAKGQGSRGSLRDPSAEELKKIQRLALRVAKLRGKSKREAAAVLADWLEETRYGGEWRSHQQDMIPTGRKIPTVWEVRRVDAWGNRREGWQVNDTWSVGRVVVGATEYLMNVRKVSQMRTRHAQGKGERPAQGLIYSTSSIADADMLRALRRSWSLVRRASIEWLSRNNDDDAEAWLYDRKTDEPLLQLRRVK